MAELYKFSDEAVNGAISTVRNHYADADLMSLRAVDSLPDAGELSILAECITVKVEDNKVCIDLPLGLGKECLPIPISIPNGEVGKACLSICTTWGIPTGVKVIVKIGGVEVVSKKFGKCG